MGIVHDDQEWLSFFDTLEAAWHRGQVSDAIANHFTTDSQAQGSGSRGQDIRQVCPAQEGRLNLQPARRCNQRGPGFSLVLTELLHSDLRIRTQRECDSMIVG